MYYTNDGRPDFNRMNRETREYRNRCVDRYNESTKGNYSYFNPYRLNNETYKANNGKYSNYFSNR